MNIQLGESGVVSKLEQHFRLNLQKITKAAAKNFATEATKDVTHWGKIVDKLLSKKVSSKIIKGRRRRPDDNPLPHYNGGKHNTDPNHKTLKDTLKYYVHTNFTSIGNLTVSMFASVGMDEGGDPLVQTIMTNEGKPARGNKKDNGTPPTASWLGWHDNIMRPSVSGYEFNVVSSRLSNINTTINSSNLGSVRIRSMMDIMDDYILKRRGI